jgi:hypothetical protein
MLLNILCKGTPTTELFLFIRMNFSLPLHPSDMPVPYVIFGDFNFRLDAHRLLEVNLF